MKGECRLCGREIETPPDPVFDQKREERERRTFFQMIAAHIDPKIGLCAAPDPAAIRGRMNSVIQDNGWFQRWRLLHLVKCEDPAMIERAEQWREFLHVITTMPPEGGDAPEPERPKLIN
jgi:hypothetical protein